MSNAKRIRTAVAVSDRSDPYPAFGAPRVESDRFWRWGDDNLFPAALALMARRSTTHRRIINDKADYITGKGFTCDEAAQPRLAAFVRQANGTLRTAIHYKDYEPAFEHYGVPPYIAGLNVSAIAYKTDRWNISRLDNSFQSASTPCSQEPRCSLRILVRPMSLRYSKFIILEKERCAQAAAKRFVWPMIQFTINPP